VGRPGARLALAAAVIAVGTDVLYLLIIRSQDPGEPGDLTVPIVAAVILGLAVCAGVAAIASAPATRKILLSIAAAGLFVMGVLGLFSIGLPLLVAGILALVASTRVASATRHA
jgi:fucose 4-O-acetylase-like acetyltransferase